MTDQLHLIDAPGWGPQARALLADNRVDSWRFELLNTRNNVLRELRGVRDFEVKFNVHATIRSGGSCVYQGAEDIDWMVHRIRAHLRVSGRGRSVEWPVGTFIVEAPKTEHTAERVTARQLQLFDMMARLQQQRSTAAEWVARKGENVIARVRYLLDRQSIVHAIEDSDAVFGSSMTWPAGTPYLRMVNDMLEVANFFSCWADPMGVIRSGPYRAPSARGVAWTFRDDDAAGALPFLPAFTHEADTYSVPNQVTLVGQSDDPDVLPMIGTARDTTSRFSWAKRRLLISHLEENVPPSDTQELMDARAAKVLEQKQRVAETFDFEHPMVPLALSDVAGFARTARGVEATAVVEAFTMAQAAGALSKTTARRITT